MIFVCSAYIGETRRWLVLDKSRRPRRTAYSGQVEAKSTKTRTNKNVEQKTRKVDFREAKQLVRRDISLRSERNGGGSGSIKN
jgi:hypothetical protein